MPDNTNLSTLEKVNLLAARIGQECKALHDKAGDLANLTGTQKASLVAALNEQIAALATLSGTVGGHTTSIGEIQSALTQLETDLTSAIATAKSDVKSELLNGAGTAYDTLKELADLIITNADAITALRALAAGHVKFDEAQTLTDAQKGQARTNIGAASASDVTTLSGTVSGHTTAIGTLASLATTEKSNLVGAINEVVGLVGDVGNADPVGTFESALAGD